MQRLGGVHPGDTSGREMDAETDHASHQKIDNQEDSRETPPGIGQTIGIEQIHQQHVGYEEKYERQGRQQKNQPLRQQLQTQSLFRRANRRPEPKLHASRLGTQPEGPDNPEKDIHQHKTHKSALFLLVIETTLETVGPVVANGANTRDIDISRLEPVALRSQEIGHTLRLKAVAHPHRTLEIRKIIPLIVVIQYLLIRPQESEPAGPRPIEIALGDRRGDRGDPHPVVGSSRPFHRLACRGGTIEQTFAQLLGKNHVALVTHHLAVKVIPIGVSHAEELEIVDSRG